MWLRVADISSTDNHSRLTVVAVADIRSTGIARSTGWQLGGSVVITSALDCTLLQLKKYNN